MHIRDHDALIESYTAGTVGPAEAAGVPLGWYLVSVAGHPVAGLADVQQALVQPGGSDNGGSPGHAERADAAVDDGIEFVVRVDLRKGERGRTGYRECMQRRQRRQRRHGSS